MKKVNIGGDRLGSGNKMNVALRNYERSTHDLSYIWRSSMAPGTLVPFLKQVALPGDTFDINLDAMVKTIPTLGPLFGSFKFQLDIFQVPFRLYIKELHNNKLGIGLDMSSIAFPYMTLKERNPIEFLQSTIQADLSNYQISQSSLLAYLGVRSLGYNPDVNSVHVERTINAIPFIAYYDIYKNYYSNKQEEYGYIINPSFNNINPWKSATIYPYHVDIINNPINPAIYLYSINSIVLKSNVEISQDYRQESLTKITLPVKEGENAPTNIPISNLYNNFVWLDNYTVEVSGLKVNIQIQHLKEERQKLV